MPVTNFPLLPPAGNRFVNPVQKHPIVRIRLKLLQWPEHFRLVKPLLQMYQSPNLLLHLSASVFVPEHFCFPWSRLSDFVRSSAYPVNSEALRKPVPKFQKFLYFRRNSTFSPSEKDLCCKISITDLTCFQLIRKFQHRSRQDRDPHSPFRHRDRGPCILTSKVDIADKSRLLKLRGDIFLKPVGQDQGLFRELLQMERCASF